jgi:hypothetical protein
MQRRTEKKTEACYLEQEEKKGASMKLEGDGGSCKIKIRHSSYSAKISRGTIFHGSMRDKEGRAGNDLFYDY